MSTVICAVYPVRNSTDFTVISKTRMDGYLQEIRTTYDCPAAVFYFILPVVYAREDVDWNRMGAECERGC